MGLLFAASLFFLLKTTYKLEYNAADVAGYFSW